MQLGFAVADGAVEHGSDFVVLVAFDIVENEDETVARRKVGDGALEGEAVNGTRQGEVGRPEAPAWSFFRSWLHGFVQGYQGEAFFTEVHEHHVDGKTVEPGGERGIAAEGSDLAVKLEEGFLGQILRLCHVAHHAEAEGVDAAFVESINLGKGIVVAGLGASKHIRIPGEGGSGSLTGRRFFNRGSAGLG